MSDCAVYVVREAERLNRHSQNALLKVLEEPPKHCFIILICSRLEKMLPTTQSRCQIIRFGPVSEDQIVKRLLEMDIDSQEATYWAGFSESGLDTAIGWATLELKDQSCYKVKKELLERFAKYQLPDAIDFAEWLSQTSRKISSAWSDKEPNVSKKDINRRAQQGLIRMIIAALADAMRMNIGSGTKFVNSDQTGQIQTLAGRFSAEDLAGKISKAYENMQWVQRSVNERLIFEELLLDYAGCGIITGL